MTEREILIKQLRKARQQVARATYKARQAGYSSITTESLIGKAPKYADESIEGLKELLSFTKALRTKSSIIEAFENLQKAIESPKDFDGFPMPLPNENEVILDNFVASFTSDLERSTLASWLMEKWYTEAIELFGEDALAEAVSRLRDKGLDYDDLSYASGDDATYESNTFINALMYELRDIESEYNMSEDSSYFTQLYNDYSELWEREKGTHIETGRR